MRAGAVVLVGLAVLAAACSSPKPAAAPSTSATTTISSTSASTTINSTSTSTTASSTTPSTTVSSTSASQQFLAAASLADVAYATWRAEISIDTEVSQAVGPCDTYAAELTTFDNAIMRIAVTGKTATDIRTLVADDRVVIENLDSVSKQTVTSLTKEVAQLKAIGRTAIRAGDVVRSDLGLPPS